MKPCDTLQDERAIETVFLNHDTEYVYFKVGELGVTKIEAYGEPGPHCNLPWIAIYKGDHLWQRIDASGTRIVYGLPGDNEGRK